MEKQEISELKNRLLVDFIIHTGVLIEATKEQNPEPQMEAEIRENVKLLVSGAFNY